MNAQTGSPARLMRVAKSIWSWLTVLLVVVGLYLFSTVTAEIKTLKYVLTPPELPDYVDYGEPVSLNPSGGSNKSAEWFHHAPQGTATIPLPYPWLIALEEPKSHPFWIFSGEKSLFIEEYMLRLGFIKPKASEYNPDALPVGIAKTKSIYFAGIGRKADAAGFTCAACHTGQITHGGKRYVVDGAPAMTDLGLFTRSLGAAFGQTVLSSRFSILDGRFERFAKRVLGSTYNPVTRAKLKDELTKTLEELAKAADSIDVTEGFTRLDALNRIGNQVFSEDMQERANYASIDAPVNYPHIWTTSWFDWVQYDGSIMQPLIRNSGEALGVAAFLDTKGPTDQRFASSVNVQDLVEIEHWLAGKHPLKNGNKFNGLLAPKWPIDFPPVDPALASKGGELYQRMCQGCHLPPVSSPQFWTNKHWKKIEYYDDGVRQETLDRYLNLKIIKLAKIGTDPAQARVLTERTVSTTGLELDTEVCTIAAEEGYGPKKRLTFVPMEDSATSNFGLALGAVVERTNQQWFKQNFIPTSERATLAGMRPNCLQVGMGYKARPLNGVWATAPFLHNGSIATIYDLLSTQSERPTFVQLGSQAFDPEKLGILQTPLGSPYKNKSKRKDPALTPDYSDDGLFILDTRQPGNFNTGHLFDDKVGENYPRGRIGRKLTEEEKFALIEYLKTL